jgi:hypothetical protein
MKKLMYTGLISIIFAGSAIPAGNNDDKKMKHLTDLVLTTATTLSAAIYNIDTLKGRSQEWKELIIDHKTAKHLLTILRVKFKEELTSLFGSVGRESEISDYIDCFILLLINTAGAHALLKLTSNKDIARLVISYYKEQKPNDISTYNRLKESFKETFYTEFMPVYK